VFIASAIAIILSKRKASAARPAGAPVGEKKDRKARAS
jgi:hypothetical protein